MAAANFCYGVGLAWTLCPCLSLTFELSEHAGIALAYTYGWFVFSLTLTDYCSMSVQMLPSMKLSLPSLRLSIFQKFALFQNKCFNIQFFLGFCGRITRGFLANLRTNRIEVLPAVRSSNEGDQRGLTS
ncbi:hypothetical protein GE061_004802 [Apolygus lucorum]|uniref:Uncharacterized protein n=1 Tax=Apolygus lucorum TaxID=248454 RepID=A0A8S9X0D8_APOLU|nr:hypothetical protein GE061_004802 [Apolygus lucorum]